MSSNLGPERGRPHNFNSFFDSTTVSSCNPYWSTSCWLLFPCWIWHTICVLIHNGGWIFHFVESGSLFAYLWHPNFLWNHIFARIHAWYGNHYLQHQQQHAKNFAYIFIKLGSCLYEPHNWWLLIFFEDSSHHQKISDISETCIVSNMIVFFTSWHCVCKKNPFIPIANNNTAVFISVLL